jgi:hypothetical protein
MHQNISTSATEVAGNTDFSRRFPQPLKKMSRYKTVLEYRSTSTVFWGCIPASYYRRIHCTIVLCSIHLCYMRHTPGLSTAVVKYWCLMLILASNTCCWRQMGHGHGTWDSPLGGHLLYQCTNTPALSYCTVVCNVQLMKLGTRYTYSSLQVVYK